MKPSRPTPRRASGSWRPPQRCWPAAARRNSACRKSRPRPAYPAPRSTAGSHPKRSCSRRSRSTSARSSRVAWRGQPTGLKGVERLDAALRFIVDYQYSYSGVRMVDVEPEHVISGGVPRHPGDARRSATAASRSQCRGESGDGDPDRDLALRGAQRRCRSVPGATTACRRHQGAELRTEAIATRRAGQARVAASGVTRTTPPR